MFLHGSDNYLISHIRPNPDLYGPFWICVTLIFSIAISGNLANYLQTANSSKYHWRYEFHIVSYAATCIFLYAWLIPLMLWGALKWTTDATNTDEELIEVRHYLLSLANAAVQVIYKKTSSFQSHGTPGLLELLCLYGYSLAIYVPVAFLLTIQFGWFQWGLIVIATFLSGGVLLRSLLPIIEGNTHKNMMVSTNTKESRSNELIFRKVQDNVYCNNPWNASPVGCRIYAILFSRIIESS